MIRALLSETEVPDPDEAPHESTGINVLEDLLKKIIPILETHFKKLTTDLSQRSSYRAHILQAVKNTLAPARAIEKAQLSEDEDVKITIDKDMPEEFIDVRGEIAAEEPSETDKFGIEGEDETGRDMALSTFKRIEANILDSWEVLYSDQDKELFYDFVPNYICSETIVCNISANGQKIAENQLPQDPSRGGSPYCSYIA